MCIATACQALLLFDETDPDMIIPLDLPEGRPPRPFDVTAALAFIGIDGGSEWFTVARQPPPTDRIERVETLQATYDLIVMACLAVLAEAGLWVASSAADAQWISAARLARRVLGRPVALPALRRG